MSLPSDLITQVSRDGTPATNAPREAKTDPNNAHTDPADDDGSGCCWLSACFGGVNRSARNKSRSSSHRWSSAEDTKTGASRISRNLQDMQMAATSSYLLPPISEENKNKKCLVLDLDETLVHSSFSPIPHADFVLSVDLNGVSHRVYVRKRPGVDEFMKFAAEHFEVVVFTASLAKYADPLLDTLDPDQTVDLRLFRESCVYHFGNFVKDLSRLGRPLKDIIIVDNSPYSYMFQPDNAIPILSWFDDANDRKLFELVPFLKFITTVEDVCTVLARRKGSKWNNPSSSLISQQKKKQPSRNTSKSKASQEEDSQSTSEVVVVHEDEASSRNNNTQQLQVTTIAAAE